MNRLDEIVTQIKQTSRPPVHLWSPTELGKIDIRIDSNGHWFHEGEPITRPALARLFASILWFEDETYYLVTPAEKLAIEVEDVPLIVQQVEFMDRNWVATTNMLDKVVVSEDAPVELRPFGAGKGGEQWVPYVKVRYELWARLNRTSYYEWVNLALELRDQAPAKAGTKLILSSGDYQFEVGRS